MCKQKLHTACLLFRSGVSLPSNKHHSHHISYELSTGSHVLQLLRVRVWVGARLYIVSVQTLAQEGRSGEVYINCLWDMVTCIGFLGDNWRCWWIYKWAWENSKVSMHSIAAGCNYTGLAITQASQPMSTRLLRDLR